MSKINIDNISQQNGEIPVINLDNRNKVTKLLQKYALFIVLGVLFWISLYAYSLSISNEDKAVIKLKNNIQNRHNANKNSLDIIKREQNLINERNKLNDKDKETLEKIVNKFDIIGLFVPRTYAEESLDNILDKKIVKFCKIYGKDHSKKLQNRCIKLGQAQMRFEVKSCKLKTWNNNCYNFRSISKKNREGFKFKTPLLDKAGFTQFESKTESIKFYAFRFFKYDYKKPVRTIVQDFTHSKEHRDNYTQYIFDYKPTF